MQIWKSLEGHSIMKQKIFSMVTAFALVLGGLSLGKAHAGGDSIKIGVIDIARVIDEYKKSAEANKDIDQRRSTIQENLSFLNKTLDELLASFNELRSQQQKEDLADEDRALINKQLETKARQIQMQQGLIQRETNNALQVLTNYVNQRRSEIVQEIVTELSTLAKAEGFDYVFDTSGVTSTNLPALVYHNNPNDLTDKLLEVLNKKAEKEAAEREAKLKKQLEAAEAKLKGEAGSTEKKDDK